MEKCAEQNDILSRVQSACVYKRSLCTCRLLEEPPMPTQQENRSNKPVRMVAVDMDGTFLNDDKTFDVERFERILTCLSRHGIYFVVASGKYLHEITPVYAWF